MRDVKFTNFQEGLGSGEFKDKDENIRNNDENVITINHLDDRGEVMGKRIMVYDALDDEYDVAYININTPMGIETSSMKLKDLGNNTFELVEKSDNKDRQDKQIKNELKKKPNGGLDWIIYESNADQEDWKKVFAMDMRKNN